MNYRDIVTSHLKDDMRIRASVLAMRRVFSHSMYEIYLCIYSGLMGSKSMNEDLVTCMVVFKEENVRVMFALWSDEIRGDRNGYLETVIPRLESEGRGPFQLIRDAKSWGGPIQARRR